MDSMRANVSILHVDIEKSLIADFSMTRRMIVNKTLDLF